MALSPPGRRRRRGALAALAALTVVVGAALAFAGLGRTFTRDGPPDPCFASEPARCFVVRGAWVILGAGVARDRAAVERAIDGARAYWSADPGVLAGWVLRFEDQEVECNGGRATGCTSWREGTLRLQVLDPRCPETAQLVHELGHVVHRDPGHREAPWCWEAEQEATRALVRGPGASPGCARSAYYLGPVPSPGRCSGPPRTRP